MSVYIYTYAHTYTQTHRERIPNDEEISVVVQTTAQIRASIERLTWIHYQLMSYHHCIQISPPMKHTYFLNSSQGFTISKANHRG